MSFAINFDPETGAPIPVIAICLDPLPWLEIGRPVTFSLIPALESNNPLAITINKPSIGRSWITKPSAASLKFALFGFMSVELSN